MNLEREFNKLGLSTIKRILLSSKGNVQNLLQTIFEQKTFVNVISQFDNKGNLYRKIEIEISNKLVMSATSIISSSTSLEIKNKLKNNEKNIGEILKDHIYDIEILNVYENENEFSRIYRVYNDIFDIIIEERFNTKMFDNTFDIIPDFEQYHLTFTNNFDYDHYEEI
jgi:chorismate-pyruvate lyase